MKYEKGEKGHGHVRCSTKAKGCALAFYCKYAYHFLNYFLQAIPMYSRENVA